MTKRRDNIAKSNKPKASRTKKHNEKWKTLKKRAIAKKRKDTWYDQVHYDADVEDNRFTKPLSKDFNFDFKTLDNDPLMKSVVEYLI